MMGYMILDGKLQELWKQMPNWGHGRLEIRLHVYVERVGYRQYRRYFSIETDCALKSMNYCFTSITK